MDVENRAFVSSRLHASSCSQTSCCIASALDSCQAWLQEVLLETRVRCSYSWMIWDSLSTFADDLDVGDVVLRRGFVHSIQLEPHYFSWKFRQPTRNVDLKMHQISICNMWLVVSPSPKPKPGCNGGFIRINTLVCALDISIPNESLTAVFTSCLLHIVYSYFYSMISMCSKYSAKASLLWCRKSGTRRTPEWSYDEQRILAHVWAWNISEGWRMYSYQI